VAETFDVIVIGAGHAGCEAAYAAARLGCSVAICTLTPDTVAHMPCNPAIGGTAKGHLVAEIDALGGLMGRAIDATGIQFKVLNRSRGPAVWSPRAQADKRRYGRWMYDALGREKNISWIFGKAGRILVEHARVAGLALAAWRWREPRYAFVLLWIGCNVIASAVTRASPSYLRSSSALPFIVTGLRLAVGRGLIGMVLADLYTAVSGIGYLIVRTASTYQVDRMFVPIVTLGLLGVLLTAALRVLEICVAPWTAAGKPD